MASPQAQTMAIPKRWPLVAPFASRSSKVNLTQDSKIINGYIERDYTDGEYWIYKRFGLSSATVFGPGSGAFGRGLYTYAPIGGTNTSGVPAGVKTFPTAGIVFGAWQAPASTSFTVYQYANSAQALVGTMLNEFGLGPAFFETVNSSPQTVVVAAPGGPGWILSNLYNALNNISPATITKIADANFPHNAGAAIVPYWAYLDGTLYIMDTVGNIWGSNINDATTWNLLNVISASSGPDGGVALVKQLNYIVALKQWTAQVLYDAGNATGSPLSLVPDAQLNYGCISYLSVQQIDNTILWLTSNNTISPQLVRMDNLSARIVSTPAVDRVLDNITLTAASGSQLSTYTWTLKHAGHRFYVLTVVGLNISLVYDLDQTLPNGEPAWYVWTDQSGNYWPVSSTAYVQATASAVGLHLAQHYNDGYVFLIDENAIYPTDGGSLIPLDIYTANADFGVSREKMLSRMYFKGDQVPGSALQVRFSDDDYQTWSDLQTVDLGLHRPQLGDQGSFWRRAYNYRHKSPTSFRMKAVDLQMDLGVL